METNHSAPDVAQLSDLADVFRSVIGKLLAFGGIVLLIVLLIGGFKYLTAGSDPKAVESAKKTLSSAIIGIVLVVASYLIISLIQQITGANVTEFNIIGN